MASQPTRPEEEVVWIWREEGHFIYVQPACEEVLGPVLHTTAITCEPHSDGTLRTRRQHQPLYEIVQYGATPALKCWAGLIPPVLMALQGAGFQILAPFGMFHADLRAPASTGVGGQAAWPWLLGELARHDRGLIRYQGDRIRPGDLIAGIARTWPDLRITALVNRIADLNNTAALLRGYGLDVATFSNKQWEPVDGRLAVSTYLHMAANPFEPEKLDIVIAIDATEAIRDKAAFYAPQYCLQFTHKARLYGLLDARRRLSPRERDHLHCLFGFAEWALPATSWLPRPVQVVWLDTHARRLHCPGRDALQLKRKGLWHHETRNRQVARVACAFAAGEQGQIGHFFRPSLPPWAGDGAKRVVVMAENVEHALRLLPKLPDWPVMTGASLMSTAWPRSNARCWPAAPGRKTSCLPAAW